MSLFGCRFSYVLDFLFEGKSKYFRFAVYQRWQRISQGKNFYRIKTKFRHPHVSVGPRWKYTSKYSKSGRSHDVNNWCSYSDTHPIWWGNNWRKFNNSLYSVTRWHLLLNMFHWTKLSKLSSPKVPVPHFLKVLLMRCLYNLFRITYLVLQILRLHNFPNFIVFTQLVLYKHAYYLIKIIFAN